jgi:hypothetical protein
MSSDTPLLRLVITKEFLVGGGGKENPIAYGKFG